MLDVAMVKQLTDIFVDKRSAIIADDLMGMPNLQIICSRMKFATAGPVAFFNGIASTHFVKCSIATNI